MSADEQGLAWAAADRPTLDLTKPGALRRHDTALRDLYTAVRVAMTAGATDKAVLERVILALRSLSLGGPVERNLVDVITTLLEETPLP